jgi:MFS family permease
LGRKTVLVLTLILMGASTFLVGCLPTYNQIGILAPILLVFLRLCQGFSRGRVCHSPDERRSLVMLG